MAKILTAAAVEKLKPKPHRWEVPDARLPNLYLIIQPGGARSWAVRYRTGGRTRKYTLGPYPRIELADARRLARDALQAVDEGRDPAQEKRIVRSEAGLAGDKRFPALAKEFVARYAKPRNRRWKESARLIGLRYDEDGGASVIKGSVADKWSHRPVDQIKKREVVAALDTIADRGHGCTALHTLTALRKFFNWLVERDVIEASPCSGVKPPVPAKERDRVLSDDELRALWQAVDAEQPPFRQALKLLMLTGQRRTEVAGLVRPELSSDTRLWTLPGDRSKNGQEHLIPLTDAAAALIEQAPAIAECPFVFSVTGRSPISGFSRSKKRLDAAMSKTLGAPVQPWVLHDLRRTVATRLAELEVPPHVVEAILNHRSGVISGVSAIYNRHSYLDEKRAALEKWERRLGEIVGFQGHGSPDAEPKNQQKTRFTVDGVTTMVELHSTVR
ncbi:site-specific integrase [Hyphomicrobium sp. D-2]|uniref:tyrosine-type recombinase/integrase n=1 Tax=Hyphomicrobium sp. D-2 TaxID=3041621 RepID=UPI00245410C0|nr:site-specific integrase [Hyphomicrobium sp. D-2]MDH4981235.1 tyrosine-type recombinase/integrase [Hyphomicrobium sp. D-2]